jgi:L-amino acid N-acyltransferase YncA
MFGAGVTHAANLSIREARPDDAESIARILNRIIEARIFTAFDTPFSIEAERAYIETFPEHGVFLVAISERAQQIVGFQSMEPFARYTHAFDHVGVLGTYVDLECRRQGIAKRLFRATFEEAVRKAYRKIFTYVRADNPAALSTYLHHGFAIVGTARAHARVDGQYVDEIIVERMLEYPFHFSVSETS